MLSATAAAASSSSSTASNGAATAPSFSSMPYSSYWEWEQLAMAATMSGRFGNVAAAQDAQLAAVHQLSAAHAQQQQQQSPTSAYYGQMAAAAAMSAVSASSNPQTAAAAAVWYNPQAAAAATYGLNYYGLGAGGQRASTAALNGYLGHYAGYGTPADYYAVGTHFPSYYAAAALSNAAHHQQQSGLVDPSKTTAASFMAHASHQYGIGGGHQTQQQQYSGVTGANQLNTIDLQSVVTGSELDSSPLGERPVPGSTPPINNNSNNIGSQIGQQNGGGDGAHHGGKEKTRQTEKSSAMTASSKRSKKKKGTAVRSSPADPNNTRVFVWELEDICSILPAQHQCRPGLDQMMANALAKLLQIGFQLDRFEEFDQANVEDAQMDEALQLNAASAGANNNNNLAMGGGKNGDGQIDGCKHEQIEAEGEGSVNVESGMQQTVQLSNKSQTANEGMRRLAAKYQHIKEIYIQHRGVNRFAELLDHCGLNSIEFLTYMDHIERMPGTNADLFRQCVRVIAERSLLLPNRCANVVLASGPTETGVAGALGRLMLCRMAEFVQPENVFCTSRTGKGASMERLANQFQKKLITLITANEESRQLANREGIPCWFLYNDSDLAKFRGALDILIGDILGGGTTGGPSLFVGSIEEQKFGHQEQQQQEGTMPQFLQAVRG